MSPALAAAVYSAVHDLKAPVRHLRILVDWLEEDSGPALGDVGRDHVERLGRALDTLDERLEPLFSTAYAAVGGDAETIDAVSAVVAALFLVATTSERSEGLPTT